MNAAFLADEAASARLLGAVPLGRAGTAEEVAAVGAFLASDEASYVTGAVWARRRRAHRRLTVGAGSNVFAAMRLPRLSFALAAGALVVAIAWHVLLAGAVLGARLPDVVRPVVVAA